MSNTVIQILRSYANTAPLTLADGELAYSFVSNTFFIGNNNNGIIKVGGQYYVNILENATRNNTANTLVLRDTNGSANVYIDLIDGGGF
jgi:hypothetical protein|tara:strand:+ start:340 stop:606 length:267 start_codon:yes stop_codon:yes gene_type:complete